MTARELQWLSSREAENVWLFGQRLGQIDTTGHWQRDIIDAAPDSIDCLFLSSYLWSRDFNGCEEDRERVVNTIEKARPNTAFGVTFRGAATEAGAQRVIRLITAGRVPPGTWRVLIYGPWLSGVPKHYIVQILEFALTQDAASIETILRLIDRVVHTGMLSTSDLGETIWTALETRVNGGISATYGWQWGRIADLVAEQSPLRFANAFVKQFESGDTWLSMENSFNALRSATKIEPGGVWAIIAKAMMRKDDTGNKLLIKLQHWYGESVPPKILLDWAKGNGPRGFLFVAKLLSVKSGQPSDSVRLLVREAPNPKEVLATVFASLYSGSFSGPISGEMERQLEKLRKLSTDTEPQIRQWAKAQLRLSEKSLKRQKLLEEEQDFY
jgi:hypothetical protein